MGPFDSQRCLAAQGSLNFPFWWGIKPCKSRVILKDLPENWVHCYGLVSYNDPFFLLQYVWRFAISAAQVLDLGLTPKRDTDVTPGLDFTQQSPPARAASLPMLHSKRLGSQNFREKWQGGDEFTLPPIIIVKKLVYLSRLVTFQNMYSHFPLNYA